MRSAIILVALCCAACLPVSAAAQERKPESPPTELWRAYPLDEKAPTGAEARPRPRPVGRAGGSSVPELLGICALAVAAAILAALGARRARRTPARVSTAGALASAAPTAPRAVRPRALGYIIVAGEDDEAWDHLRDETRRIEAACSSRGLALGRVVREIEPDMNQARPGLTYALERLREREFACLVATRLDYLASSAAELAELVRELQRLQTRLVVTEIDFDSAARSSRLAAGLLTRSNGSAPPRTSRATLADHPELQQRIVEMHASGMTLQAIADTLNAEGVPTVRGGREWRPSSLYRALRRGHAAQSR